MKCLYFFEMGGQGQIQGVAEFLVMSSYYGSFTSRPSCWGEVGKASIEETRTVGVQFVTSSTLSSRIKSLGSD